MVKFSKSDLNEFSVAQIKFDHNQLYTCSSKLIIVNMRARARRGSLVELCRPSGSRKTIMSMKWISFDLPSSAMHRDIVPFCLPCLVITLLIHYHEFNKPGLLSIAGWIVESIAWIPLVNIKLSLPQALCLHHSAMAEIWDYYILLLTETKDCTFPRPTTRTAEATQSSNLRSKVEHTWI